ncbi:MAG TPA: response regulator [Bryobacteraceae bacterium]|nr:response regulator [Bryobacteraceae bacterium]
MKTVLVVEDRDVSRELIRTLLEHSGYQVLEAATGAEGVSLALEKTPDLVLLDLQMPIKDGFQVLKELRSDQRCRMTPVVALTANAMQGDKERALSDGFTGYLTKPLSLATIRQELARLLPEE